MDTASTWNGVEEEPQMTSKRRLTICVVGSGGVGKSSLVTRYLHGYFPEIYDPTVEESFIMKMEYGFDIHDIEIIDTAGQEEFMFFRDSSLSKGDAFMGLFAVDSSSSWHNVKQLRSKIIRENDDDNTIPLIFIANKCDLEDNTRQVNLDDVLEYCEQHHCPLLETSAKTGLNVAESFRLLMDRVSELKPTKFQNSVLKTPTLDKTQKSSNHCTIF